MALIRFTVANLHKGSGSPAGLLSAAYNLLRAGTQSREQDEELRSLIEWFERHLPTPDRFNTSASKGYYRRNSKGIAWLRDTASECIEKMYRLKLIVEDHGMVVHVLVEDRPGYVAYEDDLQVIAEPFASTKVRV